VNAKRQTSNFLTNLGSEVRFAAIWLTSVYEFSLHPAHIQMRIGRSSAEDGFDWNMFGNEFSVFPVEPQRV
jgi:hypothetical protein